MIPDIPNDKPIPEPMLTNVKDWIDSKEDQLTAMECVQYGYNLAMVQVGDLEESLKLKEQENELLRNQIKP